MFFSLHVRKQSERPALLLRGRPLQFRGNEGALAFEFQGRKRIQELDDARPRRRCRRQLPPGELRRFGVNVVDGVRHFVAGKVVVK